MKKSDLIKAIADATSYNAPAVAEVLDSLAVITSHELAAGEAVTIPGIVKLAPKDRPARVGRNPRTGETIEVPARTVVTAKVIPALAKALA